LIIRNIYENRNHRGRSDWWGGGRLLEESGEDVVLIGRSDQVDAINAQGLKLKGVRGNEIIKVRQRPV